MTESAPAQRERDLLWVFDLALILKAIDGALEVAGATLLYFVPPHLIVRTIEFVTAGELAADPDDPIAHALRDAARFLSLHTRDLITLYLFLHGLVKIVLVAGIFAGKRVAYPFFIAAQAFFAAYEMYRGLVGANLLLVMLAVIDFAIMLLAIYEYRRRYPLPRVV